MQQITNLEMYAINDDYANERIQIALFLKIRWTHIDT